MYKIGMISLGCPKNQVDAERMLAQFDKNGFEIADCYDGVDAVVINTCGFIDAAKQEAIENILETVFIPDSILKIGRSAFDTCNALSTVSIGKNVMEIAGSAFNNCAFKEIVFPKSLMLVKSLAFSGCKNLKSITIKSKKVTYQH